MTISGITAQTVSALGNGANQNFTIGFSFQDNDHIAVFLQDESVSPFTRTSIVYGVGVGKFTISGGDPGLTVVMGTAPSVSQRVVIQRVTPRTQPVDYVSTQAFPADDHEEQMDRMAMIVQEQDLDISKKVGLNEASTATVPTFPDPLASAVVRYNAGGTDLEAVVNANLGLTASDVANVPSGDLVATNVQTALNELQTDVGTRTLETDFQSHVTDMNNPHTVAAFQVPTVPAGNLAAAEVQSALNELQGDVDSLNDGTAKFNANKIQDLTVDVAGVTDGKVMTYQGGQLVFAPAPLTPTLTDGHIYIGNASDVATEQQISGDATLANDGTLTVSHATAADSATTLSGTVAIANGGTGAITAALAREALGAEKAYNGLEDGSKFSLTYDASTRVATLTGAAGAAAWVNGVRYPLVGAYPFAAHAGTTGKYYVYIDATGTPVISASAWDILTVAPCFAIYYKHNATPALAKAIIFDERHPAQGGFDDLDHKWKHLYIGTQIRNGAVISGITTDSSVLANTTYAISSCELADEDLFFNTDAQTDEGTYFFLWGDSAGGATWDWASVSGQAVLSDVASPFTGVNLVYNNIATGTLVATTLGTQRVNYWPIALQFYATVVGATQTAKNPGYAVIVGQAVYTSLGNAQDATPTEINGLVNLTDEGVVFAKVINHRTGANAWEVEATPTSYRGNNITTISGAFVPTDHATLVNRSAINSHPASGVSVDVTAFAGNLAATDDTVQKCLDKVDDLIMGAGGVYTANSITTTTFALTADGLQSWLHDGLAQDTIASITLASATDRASIIVMGQSDTNTLIIPTTATGIAKMNGDVELGLGNTIHFMYSSVLAGLIEISRS